MWLLVSVLCIPVRSIFLFLEDFFLVFHKNETEMKRLVHVERLGQVVGISH